MKEALFYFNLFMIHYNFLIIFIKYSIFSTEESSRDIIGNLLLPRELELDFDHFNLELSY